MSGIKHTLDDGSLQQLHKRQKQQQDDQHNPSINLSLPVRRTKKPFVVRVSGIPPCDASQAESSLRTAIASRSKIGGDCISDITIVPSCIDTDNLVAIVDFSVLPDSLPSLRKELLDSSQLSGADRSDIHFDAEFFGLTQMYSTRSRPTHEYDACHLKLPCSDFKVSSSFRESAAMVTARGPPNLVTGGCGPAISFKRAFQMPE